MMPRTRTDLLATRIVVPFARASMSKALWASAGTLMTPYGGSYAAVAAVRDGQYSAGRSQGVSEGLFSCTI
jgi:hypothetical protein